MNAVGEVPSAKDARTDSPSGVEDRLCPLFQGFERRREYKVPLKINSSLTVVLHD